MGTIKFDFSPIEPAHPMQVKLQEYLQAIYRHLRENFQTQIDNAFDRVSSQIGYVITTSVPVILKFGDKGKLSDEIVFEGNKLKGTLFERGFREIFAEMGHKQFPEQIAAGDYRIYIFWLDALKLKLRTDWIEPAHFGRFDKFKYSDWVRPGSAENFAVKPEVQEPAHWFNPGFRLPAEELILVSVIDEVYPELRLVDKIRSFRHFALEWVKPEVMEPVHRTPDLHLEKIKKLVAELNELLKEQGLQM